MSVVETFVLKVARAFGSHEELAARGWSVRVAGPLVVVARDGVDCEVVVEVHPREAQVATEAGLSRVDTTKANWLARVVGRVERALG